MAQEASKKSSLPLNKDLRIWLKLEAVAEGGGKAHVTEVQSYPPLSPTLQNYLRRVINETEVELGYSEDFSLGALTEGKLSLIQYKPGTPMVIPEGLRLDENGKDSLGKMLAAAMVQTNWIYGMLQSLNAAITKFWEEEAALGPAPDFGEFVAAIHELSAPQKFDHHFFPYMHDVHNYVHAHWHDTKEVDPAPAEGLLEPVDTRYFSPGVVHQPAQLLKLPAQEELPQPDRLEALVDNLHVTEVPERWLNMLHDHRD